MFFGVDEYGAVLTSKDVKTIVREVRRRTRSKLLQFCENRRPAYWGTWSKTSDSVGPRRPFGKEVCIQQLERINNKSYFINISIEYIGLQCRLG